MRGRVSGRDRSPRSERPPGGERGARSRINGSGDGVPGIAEAWPRGVSPGGGQSVSDPAAAARLGDAGMCRPPSPRADERLTAGMADPAGRLGRGEEAPAAQAGPVSDETPSELTLVGAKERSEHLHMAADDTAGQEPSQPIPWASGGPFHFDRCEGCSAPIEDDAKLSGTCASCEETIGVTTPQAA